MKFPHIFSLFICCYHQDLHPWPLHGFAAPCGSHPRSLSTAGRREARAGPMPAGSCSARSPREATAESPGCALPTVFRSLDCQPWQVWAAGSRFSHFRGDLTRQVSCYTSPYRGWGGSRFAGAEAVRVRSEEAQFPLNVRSPLFQHEGPVWAFSMGEGADRGVRLGSESQPGSNGCLWKHQ